MIINFFLFFRKNFIVTEQQNITADAVTINCLLLSKERAEVKLIFFSVFALTFIVSCSENIIFALMAE